MKEYLKLKYGSINRTLPICKVNSDLEIAGFDSVGDIELLIEFGKLFCQSKINIIRTDLSAIITTEVKGICPAMVLASMLRIPVIVLRKSKKVYMEDPIEFSGDSITSGSSKYYVDSKQLERIKTYGDYGKVLFVDDVYSTGGTMNTIIEFCNKYSLKLIGGLFMLKEEDNNSNTECVEFNHNDYKCFATGILPIGKSLRENKITL